MLRPAWGAEKPRFTSWPVCPFTSFEAAQSSRIKSVFKKTGDDFQPDFHFVLLAHQDEHLRVIFTYLVKGLVTRDALRGHTVSKNGSISFFSSS